MLVQAWKIERRGDGTIIVRVPSIAQDNPLPEAVFAFRQGDSQYAKWDNYLRHQELAVQPAGNSCLNS